MGGVGRQSPTDAGVPLECLCSRLPPGVLLLSLPCPLSQSSHSPGKLYGDAGEGVAGEGVA